MFRSMHCGFVFSALAVVALSGAAVQAQGPRVRPVPVSKFRPYGAPPKQVEKMYPPAVVAYVPERDPEYGPILANMRVMAQQYLVAPDDDRVAGVSLLATLVRAPNPEVRRRAMLMLHCLDAIADRKVPADQATVNGARLLRADFILMMQQLNRPAPPNVPPRKVPYA